VGKKQQKYIKERVTKAKGSISESICQSSSEEGGKGQVS